MINKNFRNFILTDRVHSEPYPCEPCATVKRCYNKRIWIQYHPPIIYPTKKSTIKRANKIIARGNKTIAEVNEYP